jgi:hypothetical protein
MSVGGIWLVLLELVEVFIGIFLLQKISSRLGRSADFNSFYIYTYTYYIYHIYTLNLFVYTYYLYINEY